MIASRLEGMPPMEDLGQIVTFVRVVRTGSFAAAARQLKLTGSVASKHVAKLEQELGMRLLNRSTRKLSLTEAGTAYYGHCQRIVEEVESSQRALAELKAMPQGLLRVTAPVPIAARLGPLLREFLARYPGIRLELDPSNRVVDLAAEGFDLALRVGRSRPPKLVARLLGGIHVQLCAAPAYIRREGTPRHPAELERHNCLNMPAAMPGGVWPFVRDGRRLEVAVKGTVQSDAVEALYDLALAGIGISLLPEGLVGADVRAGRLVTLLPDWRLETGASLYAVHLPTRHVAPKVRVFIDFLAGQAEALLARP
jgi:DNA-binding transcriptional LysR family regulator